MNVIMGSGVTMVRGDTLSVKITVYDDIKTGHEYEPQPGDVFRFAVKKSYGDAECVIVKEIPTDTMVLTLNPSDTKDLPGSEYVYEIELTTQAGKVDTFIDNGTLKLKPEVYING